MLSRIATSICRPAARGGQFRTMMTKSKTRQATHADGLFSGAGEHAAHPEDLMFAKRTVGATVAGGGGIFALSRWWKANQKSAASGDEMEHLGNIHMGHIGGLTKDITPQAHAARMRTGVTKDIHTGSTRDLTTDINAFRAGKRDTREVFNGFGVAEHEFEPKKPTRKLGTFINS